MKIIIGIVTILFVITGAVLTILAIWGVQPISWTIVLKWGITIAVAGVTAIIVSLLYLFFVRNERFGGSKKDKE